MQNISKSNKTTNNPIKRKTKTKRKKTSQKTPACNRETIQTCRNIKKHKTTDYY